MLILLVFVCFIAAERDEDPEAVVDHFARRFNITDSGEVNVYLSINVTRHVEDRWMDLDQTAYILQMWRTFGFGENSGVHTPLQENWRICIEEELARQSDDDRAFVANFPYRKLVGSLLFTMICTRGDIAYAMHYLARFNSRLCKAACHAAKRALTYLYNTRDRRLRLGGTSRPLLSLFCDTDFAGCLDSRKSMECFLLYFGNGCIMWQAKQQTRVAQSTCEAEFCAVKPGVNQAAWVRRCGGVLV